MHSTTPVVVASLLLLLAPVAAADPVSDAWAAAEPVRAASDPLVDAAFGVYLTAVAEAGALVDDVRYMCETRAPLGGTKDIVVELPDGSVFDPLKRPIFNGFQGFPCIKDFELEPFCANILVPVVRSEEPFREEIGASVVLRLLP